MAVRRPVVRIGGRLRQLPAGDTLEGVGADPVDAMSLTYTDGRVTKITEDGVDTDITYNADGSVDTVSYPSGALTRTETYSYTGGVLTGMTAAEA